MGTRRNYYKKGKVISSTLMHLTRRTLVTFVGGLHDKLQHLHTLLACGKAPCKTLVDHRLLAYSKAGRQATASTSAWQILYKIIIHYHSTQDWVLCNEDTRHFHYKAKEFRAGNGSTGTPFLTPRALRACAINLRAWIHGEPKCLYISQGNPLALSSTGFPLGLKLVEDDEHTGRSRLASPRAKAVRRVERALLIRTKKGFSRRLGYTRSLHLLDLASSIATQVQVNVMLAGHVLQLHGRVHFTHAHRRVHTKHEQFPGIEVR